MENDGKGEGEYKKESERVIKDREADREKERTLKNC
jgi:hypothetical protein